MNALSLTILIFLVGVVLAAPRRWALLGMAAGVMYLPEAAAIKIAAFNMFGLRFLEIAGFARVITRREFTLSNLNGLDRLFLFFFSYLTIIFLIRSNQGQAYQIGLFTDAALCYLTFRGLIGSVEDFRWFLRAFAVLLIPYVALLLLEMRTGISPFHVVGASAAVDWLRKGRFRCLGSFRNPSLLGEFGASFLPLYMAMTIGKMDRKWGMAGVLLCLAVIFFSNSGGPAGAAAVALIGWLLWPLREKMHIVRRSVAGLLIAIGFVMKAPIWYLPARICGPLGGHFFHRCRLMDLAAKNIGKWWLAGMPIAETANWFAYKNIVVGGADMTNQFVAYGLTAGLLAVLLFIMLLIRCFKSLGIAMKDARRNFSQQTEIDLLLWGLGVMLTVHVVNLIGISYFDQMYAIWYMQLAAVVSISQGCLQNCLPAEECIRDVRCLTPDAHRVWFAGENYADRR